MAQQAELVKAAGVIQIGEKPIQEYLGEVVRATVEETLNAMLDAEADRICGAGRYERSPDRLDTRAGSYEQQHYWAFLRSRFECQAAPAATS